MSTNGNKTTEPPIVTLPDLSKEDVRALVERSVRYTHEGLERMRRAEEDAKTALGLSRQAVKAAEAVAKGLEDWRKEQRTRAADTDGRIRAIARRLRVTEEEVKQATVKEAAPVRQGSHPQLERLVDQVLDREDTDIRMQRAEAEISEMRRKAETALAIERQQAETALAIERQTIELERERISAELNAKARKQVLGFAVALVVFLSGVAATLIKAYIGE